MNKEQSNKANALMIMARISSKAVMLQLSVSLEADDKKKEEMMEKAFNEDIKWLNETFNIQRKEENKCAILRG